MIKVRKAGAIIVSRNDRSKILLIHNGKWNDWSFPKGHVDPGEDELHTMHREIKEETGLDVEMFCELPVFEYENSKDGLIALKLL